MDLVSRKPWQSPFLWSFTREAATKERIEQNRLPSLLTGLQRLSTTKAFKEPLLHIYDEEEDIELEDLVIKK